MSISVEKYTKIKERGRAWKEKADKLGEELETIYDLNKNLVNDNQKLKTEISQLKSELDTLPDVSLIDEIKDDLQSLKEKYKAQKKTIRYLKDENKKMEQTLTLKEVKIQQLEESRKDLKEQYNDLKSDLREHQRWMRNKDSTK